MPNFSSIAGLEVAEKFVGGGWGGGGEHVATMFNSNASCFRVGLSWIELRWVLTTFQYKLIVQCLQVLYFPYICPDKLI